MHKRIRLGQLRPGMYAVNHGSGSFDDPFVELGYFIRSMDQIGELKERHVTELIIDVHLGKGVVSENNSDTTSVPYEQELQVAEKLYVESLRHARAFMADARAGKPLDFKDSMPLVNQLLASVQRNRTAAGSLSKLRTFDEYTYTHCINVAVLSMAFGASLGMEEKELRLLGLAGLYHDVGKARIPEEILNKPGRLTPEEFNLMKAHPVEGYNIMAGQSDADEQVLRAILEHHERADASGYPKGLGNRAISPFARIVSIVDVYDALTSDRCYHKARLPRDVLRILFERRDDFAPGHVEHFIKCMGIYPQGSFVRLSDGRYGVVCEVNTEHALFPKVKVALNSRLQPLAPEVVDTAVGGGSPAKTLSIIDCLDPAKYRIDIYRLVG